MIANWMCLFVYLKYKCGSTYLFLFVRITNLLSAYCVRGPFVQTSLYISWKFWVGGNLNIINESGNHKKGWDKFLKLSGESKRGRNTIFDLKIFGENLGENYDFDLPEIRFGWACTRKS